MTPLRQRMIDDMRLRNKSAKTIEAYVAAVAKLARFAGRSPDQLTAADLRAFLVSLVERKVSWSTYNQTVCGLRFLYEVTLGQTWAVPVLPLAKRPKALPSVLSREEVVRLLAAVPQARYRLLLRLIYACGLRLSEALHLKVSDADGRSALPGSAGGHIGRAAHLGSESAPSSARALRDYRGRPVV